jgi:hypothetical protein
MKVAFFKGVELCLHCNYLMMWFIGTRQLYYLIMFPDTSLLLFLVFAQIISFIGSVSSLLPVCYFMLVTCFMLFLTFNWKTQRNVFYSVEQFLLPSSVVNTCNQYYTQVTRADVEVKVVLL